MQEQIRMFARYNAWANDRLGSAVRALSEADYRCDRGLAFGSIHGTLNHLLVGDRLWLHRITGTSSAPLPTALDAIVEDDRDALLEARAVEDQRIIAVVETLDEARLADTLRYKNIAGERSAQPLVQVLAHVFNHQTHHRGQVHAALTGLGQTAPALDLIYYLRGLAVQK